MVLLPYHFFVSEVFRLESRGHHNYLRVLVLELLPEALHQLWRETFSLLCSQVNGERQPEVLVDQGWRLNKTCPRTSTKHHFYLHKRATAQGLLLAHARLEVFPNPQCPTVSLACLCLPEIWSHLY